VTLGQKRYEHFVRKLNQEVGVSEILKIVRNAIGCGNRRRRRHRAREHGSERAHSHRQASRRRRLRAHRLAFFVVKDTNGAPHGVTVDLAVELGRKLGVPVEFMVAPNSGLVTDATESGAIDVAFMPVDDERKKRVDFGPAYFMIESTYLATGTSGIKTVADVDRPNVRVVGIANTTTIRAAGRSLKNTTISSATSVDEAMALLRAGKTDAFALSRDSLPPLMAQLPGSRIVDGSFQQTGVAIAIPKNRPNALAYVTAFLESAKASGSVRRALDRAGFPNDQVAP
jgi:polar amino acid transport system substrate-binding protein